MTDEVLTELMKSGITSTASLLTPVVGTLFTTLFLRRNTKVEEFEKIKAGKFEDVVSQLLESGKMTYLEYYKCKNFLKIAKKADKYLGKQEPKPEGELPAYDFNWFVRFYDYASNISESDLQEIWAALFANEIKNPGDGSLTLLHNLSMINHTQARFFCNIARFALQDIKNNSAHLLLFVAKNRKSYAQSGITPEKLIELQRLGLIDCDFNSEFIFEKKKVFRYGNKVITVYGDEENEKKIQAGNVKFTNDGQLLYRIIDSDFKQYRSDILEYTVTKLKSRNCRVIINDQEV